MFKINLKGVAFDENIDWKEMVKLTDGYSGSDIANVCREAALMQMRRKLLKTNGQIDIFSLVNDPGFKSELEAPITKDDLLTAIKNISKSVSSSDLLKYEEWTNEFKSH